jgi:hypothetical protein
MADFRRVPVQRPLPPNRLSTLAWAAAIVIAVAVVKPWDFGRGGADQPLATAQPTARAAATEPPGRTGARRYDPRLFGDREPDPAWELWPAGYVVFFGISGPVRVGGQDEPGASDPPVPSPPPGGPSAVATGASAAPTRPAGAAPSASPDPAEGFVVDLGPADHLIALGINTPSDVRVVDVRLWTEHGGACCDRPVEIVRLPTLWESRHFTVIGVADPQAAGEAGAWLPGEYRLDLLTADDETRRVRLRVGAPTS